MNVALVLQTEIAGRVMCVDVEGFLRCVRTLSSFSVHLTELFPYYI